MSIFSQIGRRSCRLGQAYGRFILRPGNALELGIQRYPLSTSMALASRARPGEIHPGYIKIRETMAKYQMDDGVPIHLKAGGRDQLLFGFTILLALYGLFMTGCMYWNLIYPKKPDDGGSAGAADDGASGGDGEC